MNVFISCWMNFFVFYFLVTLTGSVLHALRFPLDGLPSFETGQRNHAVTGHDALLLLCRFFVFISRFLWFLLLFCLCIYDV